MAGSAVTAGPGAALPLLSPLGRGVRFKPCPLGWSPRRGERPVLAGGDRGTSAWCSWDAVELREGFVVSGQLEMWHDTRCSQGASLPSPGGPSATETAPVAPWLQGTCRLAPEPRGPGSRPAWGMGDELLAFRCQREAARPHEPFQGVPSVWGSVRLSGGLSCLGSLCLGVCPSVCLFVWGSVCLVACRQFGGGHGWVVSWVWSECGSLLRGLPVTPRLSAVWLGVMLPVLGIKTLSPYAVSYLDRLLM